MKKKRTTAKEFARELEANPESVARRAQRERELAERSAILTEDEQFLVAEIRGLGYDIDSVWDLVNNSPHPFLERRFIGPYPAAYPALVRHLTLPHQRRTREGIVRALTVRDGGLSVADALLKGFEEEKDSELRWVFANALRIAMPYHQRRKHPAIAAEYKGEV